MVACPLVSQANDTAKYDSTWGMSIEGAYAWAGSDRLPDVGGGLLSFHNYFHSGAVISQVSVTSGYLTGSETHHGRYNGVDYRNKTELRDIPLLLGYTLNVPITDGIMFYVGGKAGVSFLEGKDKFSTEGYYDSNRESRTKFTYTVGAGFKFGIGDETDLKIGYEQYRIQDGGHSNPYHAIQAGISWNF